MCHESNVYATIRYLQLGSTVLQLIKKAVTSAHNGMVTINYGALVDVFNTIKAKFQLVCANTAPLTDLCAYITVCFFLRYTQCQWLQRLHLNVLFPGNNGIVSWCHQMTRLVPVFLQIGWCRQSLQVKYGHRWWSQHNVGNNTNFQSSIAKTNHSVKVT